MSYATYKVVHFVGLSILMLGIGVAFSTRQDVAASRRLGNVLHGVGLFVMLVGGFGMMARLGMGEPSRWPIWLYAKMAIWTLVTLLPLALRRGWLPPLLVLGVAVASVGTAAWCALLKPFLG